ncbi:MAG: phenylalanine--tRNA ligase subunit alpha, partial [Acidobacteria bacterium]|nr:phenylalanine--tRNA ligase subunit alpha [Acidobacteriota bacterium]
MTTRTLEELGVRSPDQLALLFAELKTAFDREVAQAATPDAWKELRDRWLGRKRGLLTHAKNNWLLSAAAALKPEVGKQINALRAHVEVALENRRKQVESGAATAAEALDLTLPGRRHRAGVRHILTQTKEEICGIFARIGFSTIEGPEIETDYYNFEALNIPAYHPARDLWDTLYLEPTAAALPDEPEASGRGKRSDPNSRLLLRTHTSPMQIRVMEKQPPPV